MKPDLFQPKVETGATFSPCRTWRYSLWRIWNSALPWLAMGMLNPSRADEMDNDPTVERCERRADMMGCGSLFVFNAYALRSTDPNGLYNHHDPVGPDNDAYIRTICFNTKRYGGTLIVGWGNHCDAVRPGRTRQILDLIREAGVTPMCLKRNKDGSPIHPLYVGYDVQPVEYRP